MAQTNLPQAFQPALQTSTPSPEVIVHLKGVVSEFKTALLTTRDNTGNLHSRPMAIAGIDDDLRIWLITSVGSRKVSEISVDDRATLLFQSATRFAALNGSIQLVDDKRKLDELWNESYRVWYDGKSDPGISLLRFTPQDAEYWDNSGANGIAYAFHALRAYVSGEKVDVGGIANDPDVHGKVHLRR